MSTGTAAARAGIRGVLQAPVAITTVRQLSPRPGRWRPGSRHRRSGPSSTVGVGAYRCVDHARAYRSMNSITSGHGPIAVGVVALVTEARQPALPVGGQQPERVPAFGPPRVGDLAALEHHVVDRTFGQAAAHGEAGMAGADDVTVVVHGSRSAVRTVR